MHTNLQCLPQAQPTAEQRRWFGTLDPKEAKFYTVHNLFAHLVIVQKHMLLEVLNGIDGVEAFATDECLFVVCKNQQLLDVVLSTLRRSPGDLLATKGVTSC